MLVSIGDCDDQLFPFVLRGILAAAVNFMVGSIYYQLCSMSFGYGDDCYTSGGSLSWRETGCCPGGHPLFSRIYVTVTVLGSDSICGVGGWGAQIYPREDNCEITVIRKSQKDIKNL